MQIPVRVIRPLLYRGMSYAAGETITADPLTAGDLIGSGRAVLADPADRTAVDAAIAGDRDRLLSRLRAADERSAASWVLHHRKRA